MKLLPWLVWTLVSVVFCDPIRELNKDVLELKEGSQFIDHDVCKVSKLIISGDGYPIFMDTGSIYVKDVFSNVGRYTELHDSDHGGSNPETYLEASTYFNNSGYFLYDTKDESKCSRVRIGPTKQFLNYSRMWFRIRNTENQEETQAEVAESSTQLVQSQTLNLFILASQEFVNIQEISIRGDGDRTIQARFELTGEDAVITNSGLINMMNTNLTIDGNIKGQGCLSVKEGSTLVLSNPNEVGDGQVIYMDSRGTPAVVELVVGDKQPEFDLTFTGFDSGSIIRFTEPMQMTEDSKDGVFFFGLNNQASVGVIRIEGYTPEDVDFDGTTLKPIRDMPHNNPASSHSYGFFIWEMLGSTRRLLRAPFIKPYVDS